MKRKIILTLGITFITNLLFCQVSFNYSNFKKETTGLTLLADTEFCDGVLRLSKAQQGQIGACWYTAKTVDPKVGFKTRFTFRISDYGGLGGGADGLVFILMDARQQVLVTLAGGKLGYHGIKASLAIEFDTFYNYNWSDPNNNHVSIHSNGPFANSVSHDYELGTYLLPNTMKDGEPHKVTITYLDHLLRVYYDNIPAPVLNIHVNIDALLKLNNGPVWVGFTSATGNGWANHDILNWSFTELDSKSKVMSDFSNEINSEFEVYPNPCSDAANLRITICEHGIVICDLFEISGVKIKGFLNEVKMPGTYDMEIDLSDLPEGIYFCVLKTNPARAGQTKKIIKL